MCYCYRGRSYLVWPSTASWEWNPVVVTISRHGGTIQWRYVCVGYFVTIIVLLSFLPHILSLFLFTFFSLQHLLYFSLHSSASLPITSPFFAPHLLFFRVLCYMFTHSLIVLFQAWNVNWETRHMMIQFEEENVVFSCLTADCKVSHDSILFLAHSHTHTYTCKYNHNDIRDMDGNGGEVEIDRPR